MKNFYLTFGVKYPRERHPRWEGADGAGWVRVEAESEGVARQVAQQFLGLAWAFMYPESDFDKRESRRFYPRGELMHLQQSNLVGEPLPGHIESIAAGVSHVFYPA